MPDNTCDCEGADISATTALPPLAFDFDDDDMEDDEVDEDNNTDDDNDDKGGGEELVTSTTSCVVVSAVANVAYGRVASAGGRSFSSHRSRALSCWAFDKSRKGADFQLGGFSETRSRLRAFSNVKTVTILWTGLSNLNSPRSHGSISCLSQIPSTVSCV